MYIVMNGKFASRGPVFATWPGDVNYTPLCQEVFIMWKKPGQTVFLGRCPGQRPGEEGSAHAQDDQDGVQQLYRQGDVVMSGSTSGSSSGSGY
jgi:hypothetical protein